ncbi:uncharacterized protein [Gossypium hirsutum]|uniref:Chromo domain-containing protein n=1 Tax=Gossypium hirsutum TaxID=3635 RepID=A0A1U8HW32_GOSHI|nr:uncharacterized protein LOC107887834 [Gossypium hirsutum]
MLGPELVSETDDKVRLIRDRLKLVFNKHKSYANLKRREIEYFVGNFIFLRVLSWKKLELAPDLDRIHNVFHVSMLRYYRSNLTHIVPIEEIKVRPYLTFKEEPIQVLDRDLKVLQRKSIPLVKVLWQNHSTENATWEPDHTMR